MWTGTWGFRSAANAVCRLTIKRARAYAHHHLLRSTIVAAVKLYYLLHRQELVEETGLLEQPS